MAMVPTGPTRYLTKYGEQTITVNKYTIAKLGIDGLHCTLKVGDYTILCVPFELGFKRSVFLASFSKEELEFFQKFINTMVGLSIPLNPGKRLEPVKFFLRCTLTALHPMKGRENVGLFVLDYKSSPDEMVSMLGNFMESQDKLKTQYEDYRKTPIKMTPTVSKMMGYNLYATITEPAAAPRRIQILSLNTKHMDHVEAAPAAAVLPSAPGALSRKSGSRVAYHLFFKKFRIAVNGTISGSGFLPQGIIRSTAELEFSPELVEIIDDYWYSSQKEFFEKPMRG